MNDDVWSMAPGKGNRVFELGTPRAEVIRRIAAAGLEMDEDDEGEGAEDDLYWSYVKELDAELTFGDPPQRVLEEVAVSDDRVRLGPIAPIDEPVGKIVELLQVADGETIWTMRADQYKLPAPEDAVQASESTNAPGGQNVAPSAEKLLSEGTLWIRPFGLGLDLVYGDVMTVRLRRSNDVPSTGYGPLTAEQRELAARPDLTSYLIGPRRTDGTAPARRSRFQRLAGAALVAGIAIVVWRAIDYQRRWNAAPVVDGVVVDVQPPPPAPFPDDFTIAYQDQSGHSHRAVFKRSDIYTLPAIGEKIEVRYLPEAPGEPLGPARVREIAIERFLPWGIGVVVAYFVLQVVAAVVAWRPATSRSAQAKDFG